MTIDQANQRVAETGRILDWIRAEYRSLILPPKERPSLDELERAEEAYSAAIREFHRLEDEERRRIPDEHWDMYGSGWEGYEYD
jgi:hypothetical protein